MTPNDQNLANLISLCRATGKLYQYPKLPLLCLDKKQKQNEKNYYEFIHVRKEVAKRLRTWEHNENKNENES